MHKSYTPRCKTVANSKSFELFIDMTVFLNVAVMAMNGLDFEWYKTLKRVTDVLFVAIYTGELILKVCAGGADAKQDRDYEQADRCGTAGTSVR